ncbi:MAG: hypothetical protein ABIU77_08900 [Ferruginibacter sp.]
MFDEILKLVKEHLGDNPQVASVIPSEHADAVHEEIAQHIKNGLSNSDTKQGGLGGIIGKLQSNATSGGSITSAIEGGLVSSLASKFGLSPAITGAIAGALPGITQKFANKKMQG